MLKKWICSLLSCVSLYANEGQIAPVNGINIWYETFGKKENPALLLIMGGCCQGVLWPKDFCQQLAREGFYVIRYDHRDSGLSTCFDFKKHPYNFLDMTRDAVGVLDAVGVQKAHIFGVSLGSMLAELMAVHYPKRVHTITLMGSTCELHPMNCVYTGKSIQKETGFSSPDLHYVTYMNEYWKAVSHDQGDLLKYRLECWRKLSGSVIPLNEETNRTIQTEFLSRLRHPESLTNHLLMLQLTDSEELVRSTPEQIQLPTVILHGTEDPIFPPDHGEALSKKIKGSKYILVEGMGHVPNDHFYPLYIDVLKQQASKVKKTP